MGGKNLPPLSSSLIRGAETIARRVEKKPGGGLGEKEGGGDVGGENHLPIS